MAWDDLRVLAAFAAHQNAAGAARELGLSASTVYRRIAALEESVGAPCLIRGTSPVSLTTVGEKLVALAGQVSGELRRIGSTVHAEQESITGTVTLTTVEGFLPLLVAPFQDLAGAHPDLRIEVHLGDNGPSVRRREVDVAVGVMPNPPQGLLGRRLAPIHYGVFGTPAAIQRAPLLWVVSGPPREHTPEARWEREHAHHPVVSAGSRNAMIAFVAAGLGVALLPKRLAALHGLAELPMEGLEDLTRPVWVLVHPDNRSGRVRALSDALANALS
ncbi:MAG: LysR family transcriptional regulator [Myxococcota bacterium]